MILSFYYAYGTFRSPFKSKLLNHPYRNFVFFFFFFLSWSLNKKVQINDTELKRRKYPRIQNKTRLNKCPMTNFLSFMAHRFCIFIGRWPQILVVHSKLSPLNRAFHGFPEPKTK